MDEVKKNKKKQTAIDFGSYSDLFMVMSFVFLFMYVISSLNSGIRIIQEKHRSQKDKQELENKVARYEQKVEEALTESQKREYEEVKAGLMKLQEEAKLARVEQEKMIQVAIEKEKNLVKFQDSIKTMAVIQARANEELKSNTEKLQVADEMAEANGRAIASLENELTAKATEIKRVTSEVSKRENEIRAIEDRVSELSTKASLVGKQSEELKMLKSTLAAKERQLSSAKETEASLNSEKENLVKVSQAEKESLVKSSQAELQKVKSEKDAQFSSLEKKYRRATEGLRKEIASSLASRLKDKGIIADVNKSTGDVTVRFTNAYFDYNSSELKDVMKKELETFIPIYASSLFENKKHKDSISSVEIVGSASPSFKGKYVNPRAIASEDEKNAMNYNLDLSYRRAKKIFEHTFLSRKFDFEHKSEMIPLIKVTGTGYLQAMEELKEYPADKQDKSKGFCGQYDCHEFQKVTLRFNLKDKVSQK
ncbi:MAG: hypothetical protein V4598_13785 [Bdellovibrionota bacterium]